ncbi:MAG: hypothetical protein U9R03_01315 [Candidatus Aerophobetes bacterium]|nr:hypothetical protein [Candidatus Aerophobetes bacterium]
MEVGFKTDTKSLPRTKLMGRIKLGNLLSLPEKEFVEYIKQIEEQEEFKELLNYKVVKYRKFSGIRLNPSIQFKEELISGKDFNFEELIEKDPKSWQIVKKVAIKLGRDRFSNFLKGDELSIRDIAKECALSLEEAERFTNFINRFQTHQIFFNPDTSSVKFTPSLSHFSRVAYIENQKGELVIFPGDDSSYLEKGKYVIDYERWESLIQNRDVPHNRTKKILSLFHKLNIINHRVTTLYRIIHQMKEKQSSFLLSGDPRDKVPLTQKQMAQILEVNPSTISRSVANKSIITPQGKETPLKSLFTLGKEKISALITDILEEEKKKLEKKGLLKLLSDKQIKDRLKEKYEIQIARRTITKYRRELLEMPSSRKRKKLYIT